MQADAYLLLDHLRKRKKTAIDEIHQKYYATLGVQDTIITCVGLPLDMFAESLLPNDSPVAVPLYRAVRTTGNGSCLYNATSLAITGRSMFILIE